MVLGQGNRNLRPTERGQALVEFCLVSLVLVTMIVGITDLSRLYFTYSSISNGAREGARLGVIDPNNTNAIKERARSLLVGFAESPSIEVSYPDGSSTVGSRIRVRVAARFRLLVVPAPPIQLVADSTMRIETVPGS